MIFDILFFSIFMLALILVWLHPLALIVFITVSILTRKHIHICGVCIIISCFVSIMWIPIIARQIADRTGGDKVLNATIPNIIISHNTITAYRRQFVGFGDHFHHWQLQHINQQNYNKIIHYLHLQRATNPNLMSQSRPPSWWSKSITNDTIYEGREDIDDTIELWISTEDSTVYLFKST